MAVTTLEAALQNNLSTDVDVSAITTHVNSRGVSREHIFPVYAQASAVQPYIIYRRTSTRRDRIHTGTGLTGLSSAIFSVICWAKTQNVAKDLALKVRARLDGAGKGGVDWDSIIVNGVMVTGDDDVFEQYPEIIEKQLYGRELTVEIRYEE